MVLISFLFLAEPGWEKTTMHEELCGMKGQHWLASADSAQTMHEVPSQCQGTAVYSHEGVAVGVGELTQGVHCR